MVDSSSPLLNKFFVPHFAPSHVIPFFETARLFAARGQHVTIITIPSIAYVLQSSVDRDTASGQNIFLHLLRPPSSEEYPDENFSAISDLETARRHFQAFAQLRREIEEFIVAGRPDCIFSDSFPWTAGSESHLDMPRVIFNVSCAFSFCVEAALERPDSPTGKFSPMTSHSLFRVFPAPLFSPGLSFPPMLLTLMYMTE